MKKLGFTYILASKQNGTLYIGVTSKLSERIGQHREKMTEGFTSQYDVSRLVYYEQHDTIELAIQREKQLKNWKRQWKIELIEKENPKWEDLYWNIV